MWQDFVNWSLNFIKDIGSFGTWLVTKIDVINLRPIELLGIGGFVFIMGLWLIKLVNPLS